MIRVTEVIRWKYPDAKFQYGGDQVQIKKHDNNGDACEGLTWLEPSDGINRPTKAQIDSWRANAEEAYKWIDIRKKRDKLLAESDRYMLSDYPISEAQKSAYESYRQELRDLPTTFSSSDSVVYPEPPA